MRAGGIEGCRNTGKWGLRRFNLFKDPDAFFVKLHVFISIPVGELCRLELDSTSIVYS